MTCEDVSRGEIVEKYLLGELSEETRDSFEQHYFECGQCFGLVQAYRDVQAELGRTREASVAAIPRRPWVWRWAWAPAMAVVLIAASVAVWQPPLSEIDTAPSDAIRSSTPRRPPSDEPPTVPPSAVARPSLADLARVEPPRYTSGRLRGAGPAAAPFEEAMEHYRRRDYRAAAAGFGKASALDPEAAHIVFFLGVSQLLAAGHDAAIGALGKTIALGDTPYLEEAHFHLAKAHLQMGNVAEGIAELERTIALRGERETEARRLVVELQALQ